MTAMTEFSSFNLLLSFVMAIPLIQPACATGTGLGIHIYITMFNSKLTASDSLCNSEVSFFSAPIYSISSSRGGCSVLNPSPEAIFHGGLQWASAYICLTFRQLTLSPIVCKDRDNQLSPV